MQRYLPHLLLQAFQIAGFRKKSIQNASLAVDICSLRMLTFPLHVSLRFPDRWRRLRAGKDALHRQPVGGKGGLILWRMFINYSCLQAQCTIVLSKTLTFSISLRFGASYKVHWEKEASTLRMIWRTENTTFIYYLSGPAEGKASRGAVIPEWLM